MLRAIAVAAQALSAIALGRGIVTAVAVFACLVLPHQVQAGQCRDAVTRAAGRSLRRSFGAMRAMTGIAARLQLTVR